MHKKKAVVSACLLGEMVRYDGTTKINNSVIEALKGYEVIPFCPENPIMGTPRERISVIEVGGQFRLFTDNSNVEITNALKFQTQKMIDAHPDADVVILKSKSPSCGFGTTPIFTQSGEELGKGNGLAAELFSSTFPGRVFDENNFEC